MDFIGRIKKKSTSVQKEKKKWHLKTCCLNIGFKLKKKPTINQEPVQALFTIAFHF